MDVMFLFQDGRVLAESYYESIKYSVYIYRVIHGNDLRC